MQELSGPCHGAWVTGVGGIITTLGPGALTGNPIVAPFFGAGLANMAWRITQDSTSTQQAIQAGAVAANTGVQASRVAVGGALGAGSLALGAADLYARNRGQGAYTDPAAAIAGGGGYSFALPDAPGASTRGMDGMNADQFRDLLRQAYMRGGMDMHERYQQGVPQCVATSAANGATIDQCPGGSDTCQLFS